MSDAARDAERLDRAIERLTNNQPVPVFQEDDLEELLQLARRLHNELPADLPDPLFREGLGEQLLDPKPRLVPGAPKTRRRNPLSMFGGAIAAVVVVAVAVGVVASGQFGGGNDGGDVAGNAQFLGAPETTVPAVATATATVSSVAVSATRETQQVAAPTGTPAENRIPPLDSTNIEMGAMTTLETSRPRSENVTYTLASDMPEPESSGSVYRFTVPEVDAMALFNQVTDALELDGEMTTRSVRGKTVISFTSTSGTTFTWMPSSGAFACNLSGEARINGDPESMVGEAYEWLRSSGFPLRDQVTEPVITEFDDGMRLVEFPVQVAPDVAVGHPLTVAIVVDPDGVIRTVSGYWLQLIDMHQIGMLSPQEAWDELAGGNGVWSSRTPIETSGNFEVESFSVAHALTIDSDGQLVLQPVYRAVGKFRDYNGREVEGVTVMVQASSVNTP